jgi:hypothetical protein
MSKKDLYAKEAKRIKESRNTTSFWTPQVGDNLIRILPPKAYQTDANALFFKRLRTHWNVGKDSVKVLCRKMLGTKSECPICSYVEDDLLKSGRSEDVTLANDLKASERYAMCILDLKEKDKGPQVFECSKTLFDSILAIFLDEEYEDLDSLKIGRNLKIKRVGSGKNDTRYSVIPSSTPTAISSDVMKQVPDLDDFYAVPDVADVEAILSGEESDGGTDDEFEGAEDEVEEETAEETEDEAEEEGSEEEESEEGESEEDPDLEVDLSEGFEEESEPVKTKKELKPLKKAEVKAPAKSRAAQLRAVRGEVFKKRGKVR